MKTCRLCSTPIARGREYCELCKVAAQAARDVVRQWNKTERWVIRKEVRFRILDRDGFRCRYCGRDAGDGVKLVVDHIYPHSAGGSNRDDNLVAVCEDCNLGKGDMLLHHPPPKAYKVP